MKLILAYFNEWIWSLVARFCAQPSVRAWLVRRAVRRPYTHIDGKDGTRYLSRYWLFNPYPWPASASNKRGLWSLLPSIRLHIFEMPDMDRDHHNHPWNSRSIVIAGGYLEEREGNAFLTPRMAGTSAFIGHDTYHRIATLIGNDVITIFITWKYRHSWGFLTESGHVPWREYLGIKEEN